MDARSWDSMELLTAHSSRSSLVYFCASLTVPHQTRDFVSIMTVGKPEGPSYIHSGASFKNTQDPTLLVFSFPTTHVSRPAEQKQRVRGLAEEVLLLTAIGSGQTQADLFVRIDLCGRVPTKLATRFLVQRADWVRETQDVFTGLEAVRVIDRSASLATSCPRRSADRDVLERGHALRATMASKPLRMWPGVQAGVEVELLYVEHQHMLFLRAQGSIKAAPAEVFRRFLDHTRPGSRACWSAPPPKVRCVTPAWRCHLPKPWA